MTVWTERDLPTLRGLAETENENIKAGFLSIGGDDQLGLGLDPAEAIDSLLTLRDAGFVQFREQHESGGAPNLMVTGFSVTGAGLQVLGEWPIFEAVSSPAGAGRGTRAPRAGGCERR